MTSEPSLDYRTRPAQTNSRTWNTGQRTPSKPGDGPSHTRDTWRTAPHRGRGSRRGIERYFQIYPSEEV